LAACDEHTWRFVDEFNSWSRLPVEILLLFKLRQKLGLSNPALDHPLMNTPLGSLPDEVPYAPDDLIARVLARMSRDHYDEESICRAICHDLVLPPAAIAAGELALEEANRTRLAELARVRKLRARAGLKTARLLLKTQDHKSFWKCLRASEEALIWDEVPEADVERWNTLAGQNAGFEDVVVSEDDAGNIAYAYRGRSIRVPFKDDRADGLISIHSLNSLVRGDSEIRCCVDSGGSGDYAFLALPPDDWRALERKHGLDAVAYRFLSIAPDCDTFLREVESGDCRQVSLDKVASQAGSAAKSVAGKAKAKKAPRSAPKVTPTPTPCDSIMEEVRAIVATRSAPTNAHYQLVFETDLSILLVTDTDANRDTLFNDKPFVQRLVRHVQERCQSTGLTLECIGFLSREAIAKDEMNCLLSWRDEGFCPQIWFRPAA
jgi:hypothetical protein